MLFEVPAIHDAQCAARITDALLAQDLGASVQVQIEQRRVRVEGRLNAEQALAAIRGAGFAATEAGPHSGPGSTCCGGCA